MCSPWIFAHVLTGLPLAHLQNLEMKKDPNLQVSMRTAALRSLVDRAG